MTARRFFGSTIDLSNNLLNNLVFYCKYDVNYTDSVSSIAESVSGAVGVDIVSGGKINSGLQRTTTTGILRYPDLDIFSFTSGGGVDLPFSISMWVSFAGISSVGNWLINKRLATSGGDEWHFIYLNSNNSLLFEKFDSVSNSIRQSLEVSFSPTLNQFYHLVVTDDGSKTFSGMNLYIDSVLQTKTDASVGLYTGMNNGTSRVGLLNGNWSTSASFSHNGVIDEVGIWKNRELIQADVTELYNSNSGIQYPF